jgi:hypothetical protein
MQVVEVGVNPVVESHNVAQAVDTCVLELVPKTGMPKTLHHSPHARRIVPLKDENI